MTAFETDNRRESRILLVGDISGVFSDGGSPLGSWLVLANMLDAIEAASGKSFDAIAVVMEDGSKRLIAAIKALREVSGGSKILLLARMSEEAEAIKLATPSKNGVKLADDYIVYPVTLEKLNLAAVSHPEPVTEQTTAGEVTVKELTEKIKLLEKLATEDDLTGLKNRRYIWEFSRQIIARARGEDGQVTLLLFDIDNFKHYNDVYGHWAGDEILKQAAVLMRRCCRSHDVVGRIGGDEFAVIFWDEAGRKKAASQSERRSISAEHPSEAIVIARRFMRELHRAELPMLGPEGKGVLTISGGLASFPRDGSDIDELFREADKVLLEAKRSGKNRIYLVGKDENGAAGI